MGEGTDGGGARIAVVGMGLRYAGASSPAAFWGLIAAGRDASRDVPRERWAVKAERVADGAPGQVDRVPATRGYFLDEVALDPTGLQLDGSDVAALDGLFRLVLAVGRDAFFDGVPTTIDRARTGVILGNIALPTESSSRAAQRLLGAWTLRQALGERAAGVGRPDDAGDLATADLRPCALPAGLLARALGLGGGTFTLDAACASSLVALKLAADALHEGRLDAVLAGGVSRPDPLYTQMGFAKLRALAPDGVCRPLDEGGRGLVVGEGAGIFLLKRLEDARRDGDRIYGVLAGFGLSSDVGGGLLAPSSAGQLRALRRAYVEAGWRPGDVDLIECHATGTPVGDRTELASLAELWREEPAAAGAVIGSVKANVGHTLTAAGASGLAKVLLAFKAGVLPPTANLARPLMAPGAQADRFRALARGETWARRGPGMPRRAALNGFGFGGQNAHVLIEEWASGGEGRSPWTPMPVRPNSSRRRGVAVVGMARIGGDETAAGPWFADESPAAPSARRFSPFDVPPGTLRVPPIELADLLPQQLAAMLVARDALRGVGLGDDASRHDAGVFVGLDLDGATNHYCVRWVLPDLVRQWNAACGLGLDAAACESWAAALQADYGHELTANRVMGSLAGILGSRIARESRFGGPAFTVSNAESSGLRALELAACAVARGELRLAVVCAVEAGSGPLGALRARLAATADGAAPKPLADEAVALVLKDGEAAERDGDRILAWIDDVAAAGRDVGGRDDVAPAAVLHLDARSASVDRGAASGLAAVADALAALTCKLLPAQDEEPRRFWLRDRDEGPRRARVACTGEDGTRFTVGLHEVDAPHATAPDPTRLGPAHDHFGLYSLAASSPEALQDEIARLGRFAASQGRATPRQLATLWRQSGLASTGPHRCAFVATSDAASSLAVRLAQAERRDPAVSFGEGPPPPLAFLFPGAGSHYQGMGVALAAAFPGLMDAQDAATPALRSQFAAAQFWDSPASPPEHWQILAGQCSVGCLVVASLALFGLRPSAALGYSLGESAALLALGAWPDRCALYARLVASDLFTRQLAGERLAARAHWRLPADVPVDWATAIVRAAPVDVRSALAGLDRVYLNNVNAPAECVVGGDRRQLRALLDRLRRPAVEIPALPSLHCPVVEAVAEPFLALHRHLVTAPAGIVFYSGANGKPVEMTTEGVAQSILAHARDGVDLPRAIRRLYQDGVRVFVDVGPGSMMARLTRECLAGLPHHVLTPCPRAADELASFYDTLATCAALGFPVDPLSLSGVQGRSPWSGVVQGDTDVPLPGSRGEQPLAQPAQGGGFSSMQDTRIQAFLTAQEATAAAHAAYLRLAQDAVAGTVNLLARRRSETAESPAERPFLDYAACKEYATGSIAAVLGPAFAAIDALPTRVRLPDGPLLLCHRILSVDAVPLSMTSGTLVTEHDVLADAWYLDGGRIPACIAIEAGQADLFLSGYLGVDLQTRGLAVYRLLDAAVTFHDRLPAPGSVIRYVIRIHGFFFQGSTPLFRFSFEASVAGRRLMTMEDGIAGFFTAEELASGKGVVRTALAQAPRPGRVSGGFTPPVPVTPAAYDEAALDALRRGDYAACFGPQFADLPLTNPRRLPDGMLRLVHRVVALEPAGGRYGLGRVVGEADVHPDDWFLTCHFVDDMVMPGTLMYECCLHTLRVFLMRLGWVGEEDALPSEPKPGVASRLKCRGQVLRSTRTVRYEVEIKELGYGPDAYALADATMYADGKAIVDIADMSLQHVGLTRDAVEALWRGRTASPPRFSKEQILAFAEGSPSDCFGEPFRPFDAPERRVARLPRPPYQTLDRVTQVDAPAFVMRAGGTLTGEYDVPADAWYFAAADSAVMPYAMLCETSLQPCGFFSAYMGASLTTDADLYYRNLGGRATLHVPVTASSGTLATRVRCDRVAESGGMIIHGFTFETWAGDQLVYDGETTFGFFTAAALASQAGLKPVPVELLPANKPAAPPLPYPADRPHLPQPPLLMLDEVLTLRLAGGAHGLGEAHARRRVRPDEWFFAAHFHQDPVMPGSLGLEAFLQLLMLVADELWPGASGRGLVAPAPGVPHTWRYRGQVRPTAGVVDVCLTVTGVDPERRVVMADGLLLVDGLPIYEMRSLSVQASASPGQA